MSLFKKALKKFGVESPSELNKEKVLYEIDNIMSRGSFSIIITLFIVVIFIIILLSSFIWILGSNPSLSFIDQLWVYFNAGFGKPAVQGSWVYRLTTFLLVIVSIFFSSIIIGSIASAISTKVTELREGKSKVIESNHTIILGWSESVYIIINELIEANRSQGSSCIVVLGSKSNLEMQEATLKKVSLDKSTKIIFRSGSSSSPDDLSKLSIGLAKSIIINIDDDIEVVKTILAIFKNNRVKKNKIPIACKINDSKNMPIATIAGEELVKFIPVYNFIGRIDAQACLQPGVAEVLLDLLDFQGSEIYFHSEEKLVGKNYKEAMLSYDTSCVVGLINDKKIMINPNPETQITDKSKLIMISLDDSLIKLNSNEAIEDTIIDSIKIERNNEEKTKNLHLLGWNNAAPVILDDLIGYLPEGSTITITNRSNISEEYIGQFELNKKIKIKYNNGDIRDKAFLDSTQIKDATNVLLLSSSFYDDHEKADAATLFTLINLRQIRKENNSKFTILSEVLNSKNAELISIEKSDDFVMSEKIINLMLSQLSENPSLNEFFNELMQPDGSEIYFRQITDYVDINSDANFRMLVESAINNSETAFGYRINKEAKDKSKNFGIYLNPDKLVERNFNKDDQLIVFSLD